MRVDLADEALRLAGVLSRLLPADAEVLGLLALLRFHAARAGARIDANGDLVMLDDQDRTLWAGELINAANATLAAAIVKMQPGPFQVQALIASKHSNAATSADTDWPEIVRLHDQLVAMADSPVVRLNRAVASAMADGPLAGLGLVDELMAATQLHRYHLLHATRAELLLRVGRFDEARAAFLRARTLAANPGEQRHLERRIESIESIESAHDVPPLSERRPSTDAEGT